MLSFLVSRNPFDPTFLRLDLLDLRTSKLKKSFHVFLVRVIIEKREVYDSFPDTVSKEFLVILSECAIQSHIDLIPGISSQPNLNEHDMCKEAIRACYDHYEVVVAPFDRTIFLFLQLSKAVILVNPSKSKGNKELVDTGNTHGNLSILGFR